MTPKSNQRSCYKYNNQYYERARFISLQQIIPWKKLVQTFPILDIFKFKFISAPSLFFVRRFKWMLDILLSLTQMIPQQVAEFTFWKPLQRSFAIDQIMVK